MSRWNISHVVFYSKHDKNRIIEFNPGTTIITGASRTGKSYLISAIDYCLCSSEILLSNLVRNKISHVAVKWKKDNTEFLVAREIPEVSNTSGQMFIDIGNKVEIPLSAKDLKGSAYIDQVKVKIAQLFGLIEMPSDESDEMLRLSHVSIRQLTAFLFLDKEVIDSRKYLFHGLDDANAAKYIIASLPYFLNAIGLEEFEALRRIKGLEKGLAQEEKSKLEYENKCLELNKKATSLYNEAIQIGLFEQSENPISNENILKKLKNAQNWNPTPIIVENIELLSGLQNKQAKLLNELNAVKEKKRSAQRQNSLSEEYNSVLIRQKSKLAINKLFKTEGGSCPICDSNLPSSKAIAKMIENSFRELGKESQVVDEHRPVIDTYILDLEDKIIELQGKIKENEDEIQNLIKESEIAKKQENSNNRILRLLGRVSYFLDNYLPPAIFNEERLNKYKLEINVLKEKYGIAQRAERIQSAERFISNLATKNLEKLPIDDYKGNALNFTSKKPTITLTDITTGIEEKYGGIGSDENYLSIHLALLFALHKFFELKKSPVPGVLVLDQVSRPYYPKDNEDKDIVMDEDREALERHFNFIFQQVAEQKGLQVVILEHAYLHKNQAYKKAVKYQWPRESSERLIPSDWPDRKKHSSEK